MNELKPEDVVISCDTAQPSNEWAELREWRRKIYEAVNYRGTDDHADVTTILLEYKKALLREKDAEIERLNALNKVLKDNNSQCHRLGYEDAITEMEKRLEQIGTPLMHTYVVTRMDIKQVVKDMKEDQK